MKFNDALIKDVGFVNFLGMYDLKPVKLTKSRKNNEFVCRGTCFYKI